RPEFAVPQPSEQHDLGCNGTYLVIRQLEQDVDAFKEECQRVAAKVRAQLGRRPNGINVPLAEWVAAKMVGRWRNGDPLVRFPYGPTSSPNLANDFMFGEDPDGTHCPFGAHIRRANPRDTFDPGSEIELKITNRHRILRVGCSYSPQNNLEKPGLLF